MLSIIIPSRLEPKVLEFVNKIEQDIQPAEIIIYNDRYSQGKGYAVREALKEAKGNKFIFIDGDGDIKSFEIYKILIYLFQYDVVVGCKELPNRWGRKLLTFFSRLYIKLMFGLNVDTQTGIKGFNYKPEWRTNGWAFDIEVLYKAKKMGKSIIGIPVRANVSDSKSIKEIWKTLIESIRIKFLL